MKFTIKKDNMLPHQEQWWNLENYIKLLVGGFGCGKTYIGALRLLYLSSLNPGLPVMYVSPSYKMLKKTILLTILEIMDRSHIRYVHNKTDNEIYIANWNGVLWFGSGDNPDSLRGPNLAAAGIDEPFIQQKQVLEIVMSRIRHPEASQRELFLTGTPEQLNWGYDIAMNDEDRYDVGVVFGDTRDNPYLPQEFIDSLLAGYTDEMIKAYVEGQFVNLSQGIVYNKFSRKLHIDEKIQYNKRLPLILTFDFNVNPMHAAVIQSQKGISYQIDEIVIPTSNTEEVCHEFKRRYPNHFMGLTVYGDASGRARTTKSHQTDYLIIKNELGKYRNFRVTVPRANPSVRDRVNAVNATLLNADEDVRYYIHPDCLTTIKSFEQTQYKEGTSTVDKTLDVEHITDAIGYYITQISPLQKSKAWSQAI